MAESAPTPDPHQTPGGFSYGQSAPAARRANLPLAIAGGLVGAVLGAALVYWLTAVARQGQPLPPLLVGPLVGLGMRWLGRGNTSSYGIIAVIFTLVGAGVGFVWADMALPWTPPSTLEIAVRKLLSLYILLVIAISASFAYSIAIVRPRYAAYYPPPRDGSV